MKDHPTELARAARTKIVATIGPASAGADMVRRLIVAGVDVFRLNFSHGSREDHAGYIRTIRRAAEGASEPVAVLQDLQGPRIRTGRLRGGETVELEEGKEVLLRSGEFAGDSERIAVDYEHLAEDVEPGDEIVLKDGLIELKVLSVAGDGVRCRVSSGGELGEKEGINLPGVHLSISSPTQKDLEDLRFGLEQGVDFVALSFVQAREDVNRLKAAVEDYTDGEREVPVIPKIEKPEAVERLREILEVSGGVMVARGDLGIEMPTEAVPAAQKKIIRTANSLGLPVITATQMLDSMVQNARPTRAEASDVANAILDGTDAVMLSGETSIGRHPVEAVKVMNSISRETEGWVAAQGGASPPRMEEAAHEMQHALAGAACMVARSLDAAAIVPFTITGDTARYVSQRRPGTPIYALTPSDRTYRRLALLWGVHAVKLEMFETTDEMIQQGRTRLLESGLVERGDSVVFVAGASTRTPGGVNMLKIEQF